MISIPRVGIIIPWISSPPIIVITKSYIPTGSPPMSIRIPPMIRIRADITPGIRRVIPIIIIIPI